VFANSKDMIQGPAASKYHQAAAFLDNPASYPSLAQNHASLIV